MIIRYLCLSQQNYFHVYYFRPILPTVMPFSLKVRRKDGTVTKETISISEAFRSYKHKKRPLPAAQPKKPSEPVPTTAAPLSTDQKFTLTAEETVKLNELKASKPIKTWKQIGEIMSHDPESLKNYFKELKKTNPLAATAAPTTTETPNPATTSKARNVKLQKKKQQRLLTSTPRKSQTSAAPAPADPVLDTRAEARQTAAKKLIRELAEKCGKENTLMICSRYFDKTGRWITMEDVRGVVGE
ncbi:hypothetical protein UCRPC4_g02667 [Phaeomoniella chlamydospora]|uniref:Myb-like domain-containing protein n=1 Tax=Phaeomoniella chlamydospora TaxID=158046 RepID=A0A0G2ENI3_PHACM|nr:hypothetical protein UCRPC4_g02667 [Phaeomoniella chlamydospora]